MRRGHYGIDPRKYGVVPQAGNSSSRLASTNPRKYNPYALNIIPVVKGQPKQAGTTSSLQTHKTEIKTSPGKTMDKLFEFSQKYSLAGSIELALANYIPCQHVFAWFDREKSQRLYSPTLTKSTNYQNSILSFCYKTKEIIACPNPAIHDFYDPMIDESNCSLLYLPLTDRRNKVLVIVQITRRADSPMFSSEEIEHLMKFAAKFRTYSTLLFQPEVDPLFPISLTQIKKGSNPFTVVVDKLRHFFVCQKVDIYAYTAADQSYSVYNREKQEFEKLQGTAGIATIALKNQIQLNLERILSAEGYDEHIDGNKDVPILVQPIIANDCIYAIVLRAPEKGAFNTSDSAKLNGFSSIIGRAFTSDGDPAEAGDLLAERLRALLEVAEALSGVLDIDTLVPMIMTRACQLLHTERCSLFLVDNEKKELITRFQGGLNKSIRIPMSRGIVGYTVTTGNIVNIPDAYADPRFDQSVDKKTGYHTRNLVTVPIFNNRNDIVGVTEMINKIDGDCFDDEDLKMVVAFNVFCGISLDNARLYQASLDLTRQLRSFVDLSASLNKTKSINEVINEILSQAKVVVHAARATIFLSEQDGSLTPFESIGDPINHGTLFASQMKQYMKTTIFNETEVQEIVACEQSNDPFAATTSQKGGTSLKMSKRSSSSSSRVSVLFDGNSSSSMTSTNSVSSAMKNGESIVIFPLLTTSGKFIGVMEISSNSKILMEDAKLIDCFAVFAAISLERSELREIATLGTIEKGIKDWIKPEERADCNVPEKLKMDEKVFICREFDAQAYDNNPIGWFQVVFGIFNHFDLLREFDISNEKFFRFLSAISATYKKVPYHNWRHAVDVTQYVTFELETSGIVSKLTKFDIFALLVAAICHDANHDGFTNVYNVKAETPLGILFKNQSVMETHHCAMAISVISKEETNIFAKLNAEQYKKIWTTIINLILATDMAKHFTFLKEINGIMDEGKLSIDNPDDVSYYLELILKCADISNVSRPFELADKWCDVLCEEFFRQGDLEMAQGMQYTSDLNDRSHLNKPKSQIGFYTFVCLPLFEAAARAMPPLQCNVDQIRSNLEVWKERTAAQEKQQTPA